MKSLLAAAILSFASLAGVASAATVNAHLYQWVSTCLDRGEQHLDTMVVTAPDGLKLAFSCYDAMADEIEMTVQRIWTDIAIKRLRKA